MTAYFFFFNDTATTEIYTLSLHDALPIWMRSISRSSKLASWSRYWPIPGSIPMIFDSEPILRRACICSRSEEHTSELQSRQYLVCRLLLEKKKNRKYLYPSTANVYYIVKP